MIYDSSRRAWPLASTVLFNSNSYQANWLLSADQDLEMIFFWPKKMNWSWYFSSWIVWMCLTHHEDQRVWPCDLRDPIQFWFVNVALKYLWTIESFLSLYLYIISGKTDYRNYSNIRYCFKLIVISLNSQRRFIQWVKVLLFSSWPTESFSEWTFLILLVQ